MRVDRVEREMEYLENKIPTQSNIEMEEALLEQQIKAAELEQLKKKAKINVENGRQQLHRKMQENNARVTNMYKKCILLVLYNRLQHSSESSQVSQDCEKVWRSKWMLVQGLL